MTEAQEAECLKDIEGLLKKMLNNMSHQGMRDLIKEMTPGEKELLYLVITDHPGLRKAAMWEPGTLVKIRRNAERFWVRPVVMRGQNDFIGIAQNNCVNQPIKSGDRVDFKSEEVIETMKEDTREKEPVNLVPDPSSDLLP